MYAKPEQKKTSLILFLWKFWGGFIINNNLFIL